MSYDRIWIEREAHGDGSHLKFDDARRNDLGAEFSRLREQGNYVVLVAGENFCFDELFLFRDATNAQRFYDRDFQEWESMIGKDQQACGFQEVSLHLAGTLVDTKSVPPSRREDATESLIA